MWDFFYDGEEDSVLGVGDGDGSAVFIVFASDGVEADTGV